MVHFECPRITNTNPLVSSTFEEFPIPIFCPCSFIPSSPCSIKKCFIMLGKKVDFLEEQNQFDRLQMVQFERPRVIHPWVSSTFEEFPFPIFCSCSVLPSLLSLQY